MVLAAPEPLVHDAWHRCHEGHDEQAFGVQQFSVLIEPILPKHPYVPRIGKPRVPDRVCLIGIILMLKIRLPSEDFPQEMGCCGMTLWNHMNKWREPGVGIFPKVVDGRDSFSSGELRSIFEDHSGNHLRQQRAAVQFSPMVLC